MNVYRTESVVLEKGEKFHESSWSPVASATHKGEILVLTQLSDAEHDAILDLLDNRGAFDPLGLSGVHFTMLIPGRDPIKLTTMAIPAKDQMIIDAGECFRVMLVVQGTDAKITVYGKHVTKSILEAEAAGSSASRSAVRSAASTSGFQHAVKQ